MEKTVPCNQCGKFYASAERVRIHAKRIHTPKPCPCTMCESNVACRCSSQLNHMKPETSNYLKNLILNSKKVRIHHKYFFFFKGVKKFQCDSCGRSFSQGYHLRRHQMIHTGERPFVCEICSRAFYRKDKLSK